MRGARAKAGRPSRTVGACSPEPTPWSGRGGARGGGDFAHELGPRRHESGARFRAVARRSTNGARAGDRLRRHRRAPPRGAGALCRGRRRARRVGVPRRRRHGPRHQGRAVAPRDPGAAMIVRSIDLINGRAVQLRRGREFVLDGGDPLARLEEFAVAGEVAVVDLDAALDRGSNAELIREMVRRAPCRVGGGIRDLDTARAWLDSGAAKIMIGTAASPELCGALPRERVIAAVDTERGQVVVDGWRRDTGVPVLERIGALAPVVGGVLFTQVEREGAMDGFDLQAVAEAVRAAGESRLTAAGGITTTVEIAELDRIGADAQVGMALYTGRLTLGAAVAAPLAKPVENGGRGVWPMVVCDEWGRALGLVWSTPESLACAVEQRRGVYWSRSRQALWVKGETSGNTQQLLRVDLDCDRDALRFTVRQHGGR